MISKFELEQFWLQLTDQSSHARLHTFFDMVDKNADGRITKDEVKQIISLSRSTNHMLKIEERADEYAGFIMEELDPKDLGYIELHSLEVILLQGAAGESGNVATNNEKKTKVQTKEPKPFKGWCKNLIYFMKHNWKRMWVILVWLSICVALFMWKFIQYKRRYVFHVMGYCVCLAKGGAEITKFNMALVLLPICRNTITWLRSHTKLGLLFPFNDNINFHKVVAGGIIVGIGMHAGAHLACDFPRLLHASDNTYAPLKRYFGEKRPPSYWWFIKGTEGWTGLVMVVLMAIAYILAIGHTVVRPRITSKKSKQNYFLKRITDLKTFWYSHHLFVIVYALFIVHGYKLYLEHTWYKKTAWMYVAVPMALYICERLIRASRACFSKKVEILEESSKVLRGDVLALYMTKPKGFKYTSGQYIFIKCPQISPLEWHPFSLTSAPRDEYISVHIRKAGNWTTKVLDLFSSNNQGDIHEENRRGAHTPRKREVEIDGPYGAPAQDYKNYDVLLLVGLGIGVTPFISILKDVLLNNQNRDVEMNKDNKAAAGMPCAVKKAYFYWMAKDLDCFEWFREVMNQVAEHDGIDMDNRMFEIHKHCTGVYEKGKAGSTAALLTMVQSLYYDKNKVDLIYGGKVKTHFGRPNWEQVFRHLSTNHKEQRVGVFYCGPSLDLKDKLKDLVKDFSITTSTKFEFLKENF